MSNLIKVTEFTKTPGARYMSEGPNSGEEWLKVHLDPAFVRARSGGARLMVDLDGVVGFATSFLEEAFGGLVRLHGVAAVEAVLEVKCTEDPYIVDEIYDFIRNAV
jgi:hypothetical protein